MIINYDDWQQEVMDCEGNVLLNKGRQIGGTEIFAHKAGKFMKDNPDEQIICVSDTLEQAENIIIMVLAYCQHHFPNMIDRGKKKPTKTRVWLKNKARIISRPVGNTGDAVRSFTGKILYVDEAAMMPRTFWVAALAVLFSTGGKIWASSTPRGKFEMGKGSKHTYYYEAWLNKREKWNVIEQDSEWVANNRKISETWTLEQRDEAIEFLEDRKHDLTKAEYAQEYLHEFMDDNQQWFSDEIIRSRMIVRRPLTVDELWTTGMGNDIARMGNDEGSYEVFRMVNDKRLVQIESQQSTKQPITTTAKQIIGLHEKYDFLKFFIDDEGSLGKGVMDILLDNDITKNEVIGISNSKRVIDKDGKQQGIKKTELYVKLLSMMENGEIDLLEDERIFQSFKSVQYVWKFDDKGKRHLYIYGNDTHIVEGITRATELLKYKDLNPTIYSIPV